MQTHERARQGALVTTGQAVRVPGGMRHATLTALCALTGCALLIGVGALMSICWTVHPLLTVVAAVGVLWLASRLLGFAVRGPQRPGDPT